ncbi:MAG: hypothetical protein QW533_05900 [Thermoplasmata archaeon]
MLTEDDLKRLLEIAKTNEATKQGPVIKVDNYFLVSCYGEEELDLCWLELRDLKVVVYKDHNFGVYRGYYEPLFNVVKNPLLVFNYLKKIYLSASVNVIQRQETLPLDAIMASLRKYQLAVTEKPDVDALKRLPNCFQVYEYFSKNVDTANLARELALNVNAGRPEVAIAVLNNISFTSAYMRVTEDLVKRIEQCKKELER